MAMPMPMDDQLFRNRADAALDDLYRRLSAASDHYDFEADFNAGALAIEFEEPPAKFVVSPNSPVQPDLGLGALEELQAGLGGRARSIRARPHQTNAGGNDRRSDRPAAGEKS